MKHLAIYGACGGVLIVAMRFVEYRFLVVSHSVEIYAALLAATFAAIGIWLGLTITGRKTVIKEVFVPVLELIAEGLSNTEMAGRLFVSENTIKTHTSRVFDKLGASRRTQAVQIAKSQGLIA